MRTPFNPGNDFAVATALGMIEGVQGGAWYMKASELAADTTVIIGRNSNNLTLPSDTGTTIEINNTDAANAGALIDVSVLDINFRQVTRRVTIGGVGNYPLLDATGSPLVITRLNAAVNRGLRGTGEIITQMDIRDIATPASVYGRIGTAQEMQQGIFTVPSDYNMVVKAVSGILLKSTGTEVAVQFSLEGGFVGNVIRQFFTFGTQRSGTSSNNYLNLDNGMIPGGVDLVIRATPGAASADVAARMAYILVKK